MGAVPEHGMLGKEDTGDETTRATQSPSAKLQNGISAKVIAMSTSRNTKRQRENILHSVLYSTESRILTYSFLPSL